MEVECLATSAWSGWIESSGERRPFVQDVEGGHEGGFTPEEFAIDVDDVPGPWPSRRALPEELEPLPAAVGVALRRAGWWRTGSTELCSGGLVVGSDGAMLAPATEFSRHLHDRDSTTIAPFGFLYSLPSTATAVLGLLFGLRDYQATVVKGQHNGVRTLGHALDLMLLGRLDRVVVAGLSVVSDRATGGRSVDRSNSAEVIRVAVAICLERWQPATVTHRTVTRRVRWGIEVGQGNLDEDGAVPILAGVPESFQGAGVIPLLELARSVSGGQHEQCIRRSVVPGIADEGWIRVRRKDF